MLERHRPPNSDRSAGGEPRGGALPTRLARAADGGLYAFGLGVALVGVAFLTNPVPDPSFPWATLPAELRLPYRQPRIEHWPATYTAGIWLIVFATPLAILAAYRRYAPARGVGPSAWLTGLPVALMLGFTTYCRFFWPKLHPATWNAPSYTLVCWGYCSSYVPAWSNAAYGVALLGVGAAYLAHRNSPRAPTATAAFGALALPLGLPALYDAYRRRAG